MVLRKGQTALEYLMTYGWAILIVIIAIGALFGLGLTKPCRWVGTQVTGFTGGGFEVSTPKMDASAGILTFELKRIAGTTAGYNNATAVFKTTSVNDDPVDFDMTTGGTSTRTLSGFTATAGDCYSVDVTINYTEGGVTGATQNKLFTSSGKISGTIEA